MDPQPDGIRSDGASPPPDKPELPEEPLTITPDMLAETPLSESTFDFEQGISYWPALTLVLILLCVVVFIWEVATGALADRESIIAAGALYRQSVLEGQWHRLITAMFLHGGFDHVFGNCVVLYVVGLACQHAFGWRRTGVLFLLTGVCGGLLSIAVDPGPSVGASGAIFGLLGGLVVFFRKHRARLHLRDKRIGFVLLAWAIYQIGLGFVTPFVDNFAHVGGVLSGGLLGWCLKPARLGEPAYAQDDGFPPPVD